MSIQLYFVSVADPNNFARFESELMSNNFRIFAVIFIRLKGDTRLYNTRIEYCHITLFELFFFLFFFYLGKIF